ncbi:MAG: carbamoyltransferase [Oligoflexia bacterium]|nr:carbamoyltransferase [Oligoflexia bacterium]
MYMIKKSSTASTVSTSSTGRYLPLFRNIGKLLAQISYPIIRAIGKMMGFHDIHSKYAKLKGQQLKEKLDRGERVYIMGIGAAGHNSTAALIEISKEKGIIPLQNNEEERYTAVRHDDSFPINSLDEIFSCLDRLKIKPSEIHAVVGAWNYMMGISTSIRTLIEEAPASFCLATKKACPQMNFWHFISGIQTPSRLKKYFNSNINVPVIGIRHHDNHASFPYAVSPFAQNDKPTMIVVVDGFGDDGSLSTFITKNGKIELVKNFPCIFDSLGLLYAVISSTQGGWTPLSSEGRFMGASAWGDTDRLTNPYYKRLRQILYFGPDGEVHINKTMINYNRYGQTNPYSELLKEIIGEPITPDQLWNPDKVLRIDSKELGPVTQDKVNKAAALQLIFEDAIFHIVDNLIRKTGSEQLIMSGGASLNCLTNMRLLEKFNEDFYRFHFKRENSRLHLWIPPNPSDTGAALGACYSFALNFSAPLGATLKHAFICGNGPTAKEVSEAISQAKDNDVASKVVGNINNKKDREELADLIAYIISKDGVIGLFQGASETGPRALGHRTILANACNPHTLEILNTHVKYRECFRPLAPMLTHEEAKRFYELSEGASDDNYNAYRYMTLTAKAKEESYTKIPAVIHKDGTSRIQIVCEETNPLIYSVLKAFGRRMGVEVMVNTSLNVGTPIVQFPAHAIRGLQLSRGMSGLIMIDNDGLAHLIWHAIDKAPKDSGRKLLMWIEEWKKNIL